MCTSSFGLRCSRCSCYSLVLVLYDTLLKSTNCSWNPVVRLSYVFEKYLSQPFSLPVAGIVLDGATPCHHDLPAHPLDHTRGVIWLCGYSGDGQLFIYLIPIARLVPPLALLGVNSKWDIWGGLSHFHMFSCALRDCPLFTLYPKMETNIT